MAIYNKSKLQTQNISANRNSAPADFTLLGPIVDDAGAPIDLSTANAIQLNFYLPPTNRGNAGVLFSLSGLTGDSSGNVTVNLNSLVSASTSYGVGSFPFLLEAKATSGDSMQNLMQGTATVGWP